MGRNNLTIFATYWNEKDWIDSSLAQIDSLSPAKVYIVDGCFDPRIENRSTDGTREKIETWIAERPHATLVSALRMSRVENLIFLFWHRVTWWNWPLRILLTAYYCRTHVYRLNQASTFTKLLRSSNLVEGQWFMTYDADQFYTDTTIKNINHTITEGCDAELLTATERTFFEHFTSMTTEYEARNYNNMPHKFAQNTIILPTRDIAHESFPKPKVYGKDATLKTASVGTYNHYKFRPYDADRASASYTVGDRKRPDTTSYHMQPFTEEHPVVIRSHFLDKLTELSA